MTPADIRTINPDDIGDDEWDRIMDLAANMSPPPQAPGRHIDDGSGNLWQVWDSRESSHGFTIYLGRPAQMTGPGGGAVILTDELVAYLTKHRRSPDLIKLPISRSVIKRLRRVLGHNWYDDGERWWLRRMSDLEAMTSADFAVKYSVSAAAVTYARLNLLGPRQRATGWWRDPHTASLILSRQPRAYIAAMLDISSQSIGRLRTALRKKAGVSMAPNDTRKRMIASKSGVPAHHNTKMALLSAVRQPKSDAWKTALSERNKLRDRPASWVEREWTRDQDGQLGTAPDRVVAETLGRTIAAVRNRRRAMGIPAWQNGD